MMGKVFISSCILVIILLIIITGFYQYETYKLEEKNNNIEDNINNFNKLNEEVEKYKTLLEDVSLITINNDELNLKLNNIQEEIKTLNEEIVTINDKIKQIS